MLKHELPGIVSPYCIESGEGERYALGTFLVTVIGRNQDTGGLMAGSILTGASGSLMPLHAHRESHEAIMVLEGVASLELAGQRYELTSGDYASIPPGAEHGFQFHGHHTKLLSWTFGGNATDMYKFLGSPYEGRLYPEARPAPAWEKAGSAFDVEFATRRTLVEGRAAAKATMPPPEMRPYVLASGEGERMIAGDQLFTFLTDQRQSGGRFIALITEGTKGFPIVKHFHEKHTETFFCLSGAMEMLAGEEYVTLHPCDFLHVPPGAVHSFQLKGNVTRFVGFLAPGIFEPFFRYLCQPFEGYVVPAVPPPFRFDGVIAHLNELDLKLAEQPGGAMPPPKG